jgi:serine/threonine protein phosphatase 1
LEELLQNLAITPEDELYFVGDLVDRGPDSKGVVDRIMQLQEEKFRVHCVMGNHEELMIDSVKGEENLDFWGRNGGYDTLKSFQIMAYSEMPEPYRVWFESLPSFIEIEGWVIVHAGLNLRLDDWREDEHAMRWIRYFEVDESKLGGSRIVHGHTPMHLAEIRQQLGAGDPAVDLDNGCVYPTREGMGGLCCLDLDSLELEVVPNRDL